MTQAGSFQGPGLRFFTASMSVSFRAEVVQTFRSARHGRPEGLHYDGIATPRWKGVVRDIIVKTH
jgi:hypothetical protein